MRCAKLRNKPFGQMQTFFARQNKAHLPQTRRAVNALFTIAMTQSDATILHRLNRLFRGN